MSKISREGFLGRREFLRRSAVTGLGVGLYPLSVSGADEDPPRIERFPRLGRTGFEVSDISFGGSRLSDDRSLVDHALDRGVNYFDTADRYRGGSSEQTLGRALEGKRDKVYIASKVKASADATQAELMESLEGSLRRLRTDRIDVYLNHAINDLPRIQNPEWAEFTERAKQQGKIRYRGMSGHGGRLVECLDYAIDNDLVDVVLVAYNFGQDPGFMSSLTRGFDFVAIQPDLPRVLGKAKQKDVGVVAMKTLRGAKLNDMRPYERSGATFAQAALRWTLSQPYTDALIISMTSHKEIEEYLGASGAQATSRSDLRLLERYYAATADTQCRYGCRECESACPYGVPIADVLRTRMYDQDYGDRELARADYAQLGAGAAPCLACSERTCASACPIGLRIPELLEPVHGRLATG